MPGKQTGRNKDNYQTCFEQGQYILDTRAKPKAVVMNQRKNNDRKRSRDGDG